MNPTTILFVALISAAAMAGWALLIIGVPNMLCSVFRHRMWRVRDSLVDDVIHKRLPKTKAVTFELEVMHHIIRDAENISIWAAIWRPRPRPQVANKIEKDITEAIESLDEESRDRLEAYRRQTRLLLGWYLAVGSPLGWCFFAFHWISKPLARSVKTYSQWLQKKWEAVVKRAMYGGSNDHKGGDLTTCVG